VDDRSYAQHHFNKADVPFLNTPSKKLHLTHKSLNFANMVCSGKAEAYMTYMDFLKQKLQKQKCLATR
jgi:hypothetical protein